ncbi:MAG: serine hydrolase domain-containing protein [Alkalilacustris sp.]
MSRMTGALAFAAGLGVASAGLAQGLPEGDASARGFSTDRLERIASAFEAEVDRGALPGAVIMVARGGELVYSTALGSLDPAAGTAMPEDAIFRIYSMTKPVTSVAALMLMEEGKLHLTDPVSRFLPAFAETQVVTEDGTEAPRRQMTIQDLLRHTSGLAYGEITRNEAVREGYTAAGAFNPDILPFDSRHIDAAEQTAGVAATPLLHHPGTVFEYGFSTDILGRVVEEISGQRLADFLDERLFGPLGMQDTGFHVPENALTRLAETLEVDPATGNHEVLMDVSAPPANDSGGAGAVSTAADYLRFAQMLANGGELDGVRILSPSTVRLMASDHLGDIDHGPGPGNLLLGTPGYGFGLGVMVREHDGISAVPGAPGQFMWAGYGGTYFWVDPAEDLVAVLMSARWPERAFYRRHLMQLVYQAMTDDAAD